MKSEEASTSVPQEAQHIPPPLIVAGLTLAGLVTDRMLGRRVSPRPMFRAVSRAIGITGGAFIASAFFAMIRAGNSPDPRTPVRRLNKDGIYRMSRNPIYVGMICSQVAVGVARRSIVTILLAPIGIAILHSKVIAVEESYLESVFGDEYRDYCAQVPRWFGFGRH